MQGDTIRYTGATTGMLRRGTVYRVERVSNADSMVGLTTERSGAALFRPERFQLVRRASGAVTRVLDTVDTVHGEDGIVVRVSVEYPAINTDRGEIAPPVTASLLKIVVERVAGAMCEKIDALTPPPAPEEPTDLGTHVRVDDTEYVLLQRNSGVLWVPVARPRAFVYTQGHLPSGWTAL